MKNILSPLLSVGIVCVIALGYHSAFAQKGHYFNYKDSRIYYEDNGRGDVVFLLHAGLMDHVMWEKQVNSFSKSFRVITTDLRGHGLTINGEEKYLACDAIASLMDSLKIQQATLVGLSLGAMVVVDFALHHPDRTKRIVLCCPGLNGWKWSSEERQFGEKFFAEKREALQKSDTAAFAEAFAHEWGDGPHRAPNQLNAKVRTYVKNTAFQTCRKNWFKYWPSFYDTLAVKNVAKIKCRTLIIEADQDSQDIIDVCNFLHNKIPAASKVIVTNAAHMVNLEKPNEFNKAVLDFLRK